MNTSNQQCQNTVNSVSGLPEIIATQATDDGREYRLQIAPDLVWFDGHFPGDLILPAVVQADWAIQFGRDLGFDPNGFIGFSRLKFKQVIQPPIELKLVLSSTGAELRFVYQSATGVHSQGTVQFGRGP